MYVNLEPFGYQIYGEIIGSAWLSLVEVILKNGDITEDEGRKRLCLQNVRIKIATQTYQIFWLKNMEIKKYRRNSKLNLQRKCYA